MVLNDIIIGFKLFMRRWFHKRNIIIVSEHKVKHLHISTATQCVLLTMFATLCLGASYYTGQYASQHAAVEKQTFEIVKTTPAKTKDDTTTTQNITVSAPKTFFGGTDIEKTELIARVALLEQQVTELETAKKNIIERVRDKTSGQIDNLEKIIQQTGLSPKELKKRFSATHDKKSKNSVGGPYIADGATVEDPKEKALYARLDDLSMLREIINDLPLAMPMKNGDIHSHYGRRIDPFNRRLAFHSGMDLTGPTGAKIYSTADGVIVNAKRSKSYGYFIDIDHGYDITTRYAHLSKLLVKKGQKVKKGAVIGIQGSTGRSTGQHLHYEVRYRNKALNPKRFVDAGRNVSQK